MHRVVLPALIALGALAVAPSASAGTLSCAEGRCSTAAARLKLEGRDGLYTSIDTGWMPECDNGQDHCNKGLQVRAGIAFTAVTKETPLFTAEMQAGAVVEASWEDEGKLVLKTDSIGVDSTLSVTHSLAPQIELYVDVGIIEQGFVYSRADLLGKLPGAKFDYVATGSGTFKGWGFDGGSATVGAPALQNTQIFSIDLNKLSVDKVMQGQLALHANTKPTFTYKTTKVIVDGKALLPGTAMQFDFPEGDFDYLDMPATIEGTMSAKGEMEVLPSVTLSQLGDANFSPAMTITFSSVKAAKSFDTPPQTYVFPDKTIHIPLPNVRRPAEGLFGEAEINSEGTIPAIVENTGEAQGMVRLESSDPRFVVPVGAVSIAPKSKQPLGITFRPDGLGPASATITAYSNDPDTPEFTFTVQANGVEVGQLGKGGKGGSGADDEDDGIFASGCGCRTTGSPASGYAGLAAAAFALGAVLRRRRR